MHQYKFLLVWNYPLIRPLECLLVVGQFNVLCGRVIWIPVIPKRVRDMPWSVRNVMQLLPYFCVVAGGKSSADF